MERAGEEDVMLSRPAPPRLAGSLLAAELGGGCRPSARLCLGLPRTGPHGGAAGWGPARCCCCCCWARRPRCPARWEYSLPYTPQSQQCKDPGSEYFEKNINKCCSQCPPGYHVLQGCNSSADTECAPCERNMYTAIWNRARRCFGCSPPCRTELVQTQECTGTQDRICICAANTYCVTKTSQSRCLYCKAHKICGKGYGVSKPGTESRNTECSPCPPGMFSDEESSTASCKLHRDCQSVSVQGNNRSDTVCSESEVDVAVITVSPLTTAPSTRQLPAQSSTFRIPEIRTKAVHQGPSADVSQTIGIIIGLTFLVLLALAVVACFIACRKKAAALSQPFLSPEKQPDKRQRCAGAQSSNGPEQEEQHLLETPGSSSNSLDKSAARINGISIKNTEKKETEKTQQRPITSEGCKHHSGTRPNSASSEHSANGGTQVNVTCIVNVCNSNHNPQFPEQTTSTSMDYGNVPYCAPTEEEIPLSKEENPFKRESEIQILVEAADSLPPNLLFPEGKPFPLSVQDVGMKT
ncbi:tumor necrosis factor receptor superfamily member 1B [Emydura macquarii macquarii]|uniref:tumor necrosis factor receptor superfamily member 1B n=1 Tax=Emydura macquarii macquarii TaxID=1129001 RepID=UPI003529E3CA